MSKPFFAKVDLTTHLGVPNRRGFRATKRLLLPATSCIGNFPRLQLEERITERRCKRERRIVYSSSESEKSEREQESTHDLPEGAYGEEESLSCEFYDNEREAVERSC